ncbi:fibronectin type III domain-containing protein 1 [Conger conger]|uniref:fibronectin type III domain-containing protein 1 n=1 Tax=Conger conger TaxID=82655 RepID=UPI002A59E173|nr:fibronectin type III domain-containing protein 1 [Conger conger]
MRAEITEWSVPRSNGNKKVAQSCLPHRTGMLTSCQKRKWNRAFLHFCGVAPPPLRPQNVKLAPAERGLLVSWDPPGEPDARPVERYSLGYGTSMKSLRYLRVDGSRRSQILEDVEPGVLHFLKMAAENSEGMSKPVYRAETPTGGRLAKLDGFAVGRSLPANASVAERRVPSRTVRVPERVVEQRRPPHDSGAVQPERERGFLLGLAQNDRRTGETRRPSTSLQAEQRRPSTSLQAEQRRPSTSLQEDRRRPSAPVQAEQRSPRRRNLASESVYVVSLQAQKALGQSSPVQKAFTNKKPPPDSGEIADVKDISVRVMSPQSVFVSWVDPEVEKEKADSNSRYYTVRYREKGESARWDYRETTQRRLLVDTLTADNMYEFSIRISQGDRTSKWSVSVFQRTPESAPTGAPENFNVKPLRGKGTAVTATWEPPEEPNGRIREYIVSYAPALKPFGAKTVTVRGSGTSAVVEGLQPGERYIFKIRAVNRRGQGPQSKAFSVAMPATSSAASASSHHSRSQGLSRPSRPYLRKDTRVASEEDSEEEDEEETRSYHSVFSSVRSPVRTRGGSRTPQASERAQETLEEEKEEEAVEEEQEQRPTEAAKKEDAAVSYPEKKDSYDQGVAEPKPAPKEPSPQPGGNGGGPVLPNRYPGRRKPGVLTRGKLGRFQNGQRKPGSNQSTLPSATGAHTRPEEEEETEETPTPTPRPTTTTTTATTTTTTTATTTTTTSRPAPPALAPSVQNRQLRPGSGGRGVPRQGGRVLTSRESSLASVGAQTPQIKQPVASLPDVSVSQDTSSYNPVPKSPATKDDYKEAYGKNADKIVATVPPKPATSRPELSENDSIERDSVPERPRVPTAPRRPVIGPNGRLRYPNLANRQVGSRTRFPGRTAGKVINGGSKPSYEQGKNGRPNLTATNGNAKPASGRRFITSPEGLKWIVDLDKGLLMNENGRILQDSQGKPRRVILGEDGRTIFDDQGSPLVNSEGLALFGHGRDSRPVVNPKDKFFTMGGKQIVGLDRPTPKTTTTTTTTIAPTTAMTTTAPTTTPEPTTLPTTTELITEEPVTSPHVPACPPGTYPRMDDQGFPMFDDEGILNCYSEEGSSGMGMDPMVTVAMATDRADALAIEEENFVIQTTLPPTTTALMTQPVARGNSGPSSEFDAAGKKRFTAPYVNYIRKDPGAPCSLTEALEYLQMDVLENLIEQDSVLTGRPPKHKPHNFTVVAMEGCHSFVILDWARPLKDDMVSGYKVHSASYDDVLNNRWSSRSSTGTHLSVENLKPNARYYFKVQAKNVFGLGPLSETITYVTESDDPLLIDRPPGGEPIWVPFTFKYNPAHSVCKGSQFVKRTWYKKFVGVVLCNSLRYKIFMGEGLKDTFYSIGDTFGYGEDHCQFVDSYMAGRTGPQSLSAYLPTAQGYYRAYRQEPVLFGPIGRNTAHNFVGWYECGVPIPGKW